jgi:ABC-type nickel/cobalt efflux system permease component RcnA
MTLLPLVTALVAGFAHALEPDHMAAVTTFVSRRPRPLEALGFGIRWGLGHSAAIVAVGGVLVLLDLRIPDGVARGLEFGVGGLLLALGLWLLWSILHGRAHALAGRGHAHPHGAHHHHDRGGSLWVGVAHGLAGTAPLIALLPVALTASPAMAAGYLLFFGLGTTVAMGIYALVAGALFHQAGHRFPALAGVLRAATAVGSVALGIAWMYGAAA